MTTRLQVYNGALMLVGELRLASLSENRESRRLLDEVWNDNGVRFCIEQAQWHFAMRSSRLDYNPAIVPDWGYQRAFDKPSDWVATSGVFQDEYNRTPLTDYADEIGYWFSDLDQIFVRYVSDDASYGGDLSRWPASFADYVKAYFASRIVHKMPGDNAAKVQFLLGPPGRETHGYVNRCLLIARNRAAMALPATFPARGTWATARRSGHRGSWRDGGNQNSLIG